MSAHTATASRRVMLVSDASRFVDSQPEIVSLPHPCDGRAANYAVNDQGDVWELQSAKRDLGSWFIDNFVEQNGALLVTTPIDALFIVLQALSSTTTNANFAPLSQSLYRPAFPGMVKLVKGAKPRIGTICDIHGDFDDDDMILVKLSADKVSRWLGRKIRRISQTIIENGLVSMSQSSQVSTFNSGSTVRKANGDAAQTVTPQIKREGNRLALQILTEYTPKHFLEPVVIAQGWTWGQIMAHKSGDARELGRLEKEQLQGISQDKPKAASSSWEESNGYSEPTTSKHMQYTQGMPTKGASSAGNDEKKRKKPEMSVAARRLAQVDTRGMKSMMSFFGKKPAKK